MIPDDIRGMFVPKPQKPQKPEEVGPPKSNDDMTMADFEAFQSAYDDEDDDDRDTYSDLEYYAMKNALDAATNVVSEHEDDPLVAARKVMSVYYKLQEDMVKRYPPPPVRPPQ